MPFIIPRKRQTMRRNGKALFNRYQTLDDAPDFLLQARRRQYTKKKAIRNFRIVTKKTPLFEIAYSGDLAQLRAREWNYVRVDLPQIMPSYLEIGSKARRTWLVAHFTQVAVAVDGATELPADDYDSGDDGGALSEDDDEFVPSGDARAMAMAYHADQSKSPVISPREGAKTVPSVPRHVSGDLTSDNDNGAKSEGGGDDHDTDGPTDGAATGTPGGGGGINLPSPNAGLDLLRQRQILARDMSSTLRRSSLELNDLVDTRVTPMVVVEPMKPGIHLVGPAAWYTSIAVVNLLCILSRIVGWDIFVGLLVLVNTVGVMKLLSERDSESKRSQTTTTTTTHTTINATPRSLPPSAYRGLTPLATIPSPLPLPSSLSASSVASASLPRPSAHRMSPVDSAAESDVGGDVATTSSACTPSHTDDGTAGGTSDGGERGPRIGLPLFCSVDPTSFNVRVGPDYKKNKRKAPSASAFYDVVHYEAYQSPTKVEHVEKYLQREKATGGWVHGLPPTFIVNVMIPGYPPANPIWGKAIDDGPGFNWIFVLELNAQTRADLASGNINNALRLLQNYFASEEGDPLRDRFKGIPRLFNVDEVNLGGTGKRLVQSYNAKPLLTRPQHNLYKGDDYAELDVDVHRFAYIARQGADSFRSKVKLMILDVGFVIEGHSDDELPEQLLGCVRVNYADFENAPPLPTVPA